VDVPLLGIGQNHPEPGGSSLAAQQTLRSGPDGHVHRFPLQVQATRRSAHAGVVFCAAGSAGDGQRLGSQALEPYQLRAQPGIGFIEAAAAAFEGFQLFHQQAGACARGRRRQAPLFRRRNLKIPRR